MACLVDHRCSRRRWGDGNLAADDTRARSDRTVGGDVERAGKAVVLGGPIEGRSIGESTLPWFRIMDGVHVGNVTPRLAVESGCWAKAIDTNRPESVNGIDNALMNDIALLPGKKVIPHLIVQVRRMASGCIRLGLDQARRNGLDRLNAKRGPRCGYRGHGSRSLVGELKFSIDVEHHIF
jgi:hypothetical protein